MMVRLLIPAILAFSSLTGTSQTPSELARGYDESLRTIFLAKETQEPLHKLSLELATRCQQYPGQPELKYLYLRALELLAEHPRWQGPPDWRTEAAKAVLLFPDSCRILTLAARADGTESTARKAFELDPTYGPARVVLAKALLQSRHAHEARSVMEDVQGLDALPDGWLTLARARFETGDLPGAMKAAKNQLKAQVRPSPEPTRLSVDEHTQAQQMLGKIRKQLKNTARTVR